MGFYPEDMEFDEYFELLAKVEIVKKFRVNDIAEGIAKALNDEEE